MSLQIYCGIKKLLKFSSTTSHGFMWSLKNLPLDVIQDVWPKITTEFLTVGCIYHPIYFYILLASNVSNVPNLGCFFFVKTSSFIGITLLFFAVLEKFRFCISSRM